MLTTVATIQQGSHVIGQNAASHCRIPGKGSELFFSFESATASCVSSGDLNLVETSSDVCWSRPLSAGTPSFVLDPMYRNTGAVLVQRAVQLPHVEREVQRRKNKLGTEALRTFAWINCAERTWFFSRVCSRGERERERERERVDRTYRWRKFRFQWLSQPFEEGQERLEVQVRGAWSGKAHRSVPTGLERTDRVFPAIYFQPVSWGAARAAPNGVKEGTTFRLVFRCLNHTFVSWKVFHGFQKGQVHSGKQKLSKKYFCRWSSPGSPPAGLKFLTNHHRQKQFSQNERRKADLQNVASGFLIFAPGLSYDLSKFSENFNLFFRLQKTILNPSEKN